MSHPHRLVVMGLKASGKTSYLAALWHHLESAERASRLSAPTLQPDREYLNSIRANWVSGVDVGRTSSRGTQQITLPLRDSVSENSYELQLPDLSGEAFKAQWETRKATESYAEYVSSCDGALLLIHPHGITKTTLIGPQLGPTGLPEDAEMVPWSPALSSTQVQLVELLQMFLDLRSLDSTPRIAVGISAWDLVEQSIPPGEWVDRKLPLLTQFLRSNDGRFTSKIYGVSALGGDLEQERERLLQMPIAADRPSVVDETLERRDISAPLTFLLGLDEQ